MVQNEKTDSQIRHLVFKIYIVLIITSKQILIAF